MTIYKRKCRTCKEQFETMNPNQRNCDKNHCMKCGKVFTPERRYQIFCSEECDLKDKIIQAEFEKRFYIECRLCGQTFRKKATNSRERTCESCRYATKRKDLANKVYDNTKEKKKSKMLPLEELNRRAEYKRLMDERWAAREITGKKWE